MYSIGIDAGYSSVKVSLINENGETERNVYKLHKGKIKETLLTLLKDLLREYSADEIKCGAVTGSMDSLLVNTGSAVHVNEVTALIEGSAGLNSEAGSIIEIGGQSGKFITGFRGEDRSNVKISMNSSCSAGTGSFLEEQVSRLNLKIEDYSALASKACSIPRIAGRCSVFAKTDIIHHQQEGVPVEDILSGLAYALVKNYRGVIIKKNQVQLPVLFTGGVAYNSAIAKALIDTLKLKEGELLMPEYPANTAASGAALIAAHDNISIDLEELALKLESEGEQLSQGDSGILLPCLRNFGYGDSLDKHNTRYNAHDNSDCYLGIDIGSTSTNVVLINRENEIIDYQYLRTMGDPAGAVKQAFENIRNKFGDKLNVLGVCTTGSGRYMIGELVGADIVKDEITAQAKAAVTIDSDVDTVFEIGGQDSKFIRIDNGVVTDFQMNKICAAGTGSFIEEQAKKFSIPVDSFAEVAMSSDSPVYLGERCTVFIESSIAGYLSRGTSIEDIAAGLCFSIVRNYIDRVVGQKKPGKKIFFQGGVAYNQGVVNAFRAVTGREIVVPPFFSVTGAYGAAILAKEECTDGISLFKGFSAGIQESAVSSHEPQVRNESIFNNEVNRVIFKDYSGVMESGKKTVGIPRALFTFGMFPMFNAFFKELGFNVLLSEPTSEETIRLGQEFSMDEACYPVKLINGHVAELVAKGVDYIFFPDLYTVDHPDSEARKNYGCAYMQLAFKVVNIAMDLQNKGIKLLSPTIAFNLGKEFMMKSFAGLAASLGRSPEETAMALQSGMKAYHEFEERLGENGKEVLSGIKPGEKVFVLISKIYGVADPVLNMGIPGKLASMGYRAVPFYNLPQGNAFSEHPNMFWPFGQHILEPAQLVKEHPNFYAILLTHHGCGPDTVLSHYVREIMDGKKFLHIEVDEHSSSVGVITRIEAFVNSLGRDVSEDAMDVKAYAESIPHKQVNIKSGIRDLDPGVELYIPNLFPYSDIYREVLAVSGVEAKVIPQCDALSLNRGRSFTSGEEYFSMTALLGDCIRLLETGKQGKRPAFLIPQTEGAEVEGQYSRFLRMKFDEEGFADADIVSPFLEDIIYLSDRSLDNIFLTLIAGDIVLSAHREFRDKIFGTVLDSIKGGAFNITQLRRIAEIVSRSNSDCSYKKTILAAGETSLLYSGFLNNFTFKRLEDEGHRIIYTPLSECMWLFWRDYIDQNASAVTDLQRTNIGRLEGYIIEIAESLRAISPFDRDLMSLAKRADRIAGYYSGGNGRYRAAKITGDKTGISGIITASSMYENTAISLNILQNSSELKSEVPVLNLTFDGNRNENDETKVESFIYYLK